MFPMYFEETLVLIGQHSENISQIIDTFSVHLFKSPVNSAFASFADRFSKHWFARLVSLNK